LQTLLDGSGCPRSGNAAAIPGFGLPVRGKLLRKSEERVRHRASTTRSWSVKAFVHTAQSTWQLEGEDWDVVVNGDVATLWRHRAGRSHDEKEPAAVVNTHAGAYILFGDDHPGQR